MPNYMPLAVTIKDIHDTAENTKTFIFDLKNLGSKPGQFVNIWIPDVDEKPYSIAEDNNEELWLTVCKVGPFSSKLFTMKKGDKVGVRGPFGKGFTIFEDKTVVLVGGGFGMAPLHFLGKKLQQNGSKVFAAIGARNKKFLVFEDKCLGSGFETCVATDDGSAGHQGFSTELLRKILTENKIDAVQTCGPELMMKKVAAALLVCS
jgi:dihydroorotate dehydrogenase electron transfer subunit